MSASLIKWLVAGCVLALSATPTAAVKSDVIYTEPRAGGPMIVVSMSHGPEERVQAADIQGIAERLDQSATILFYLDYRSISRSEPIAVYVKGTRVLFNATMRRSCGTDIKSSATCFDYREFSIAWWWANLVTRKPSGSRCNDGFVTKSIDSAACANHSGLDRLEYSSDTVLATICDDYSLLAGRKPCPQDRPALLVIPVQRVQ